MESPKRQNIRLHDYDYSQNGAYFIAICTKDRRHFLGEIVGDAVPYRVSDSANSAWIKGGNDKTDWLYNLATLIPRPYHPRRG